MSRLGAVVLAAWVVSTMVCPWASARDLPDLVISRADLASTGDCSGTNPLIAGRVYVKNIGIGRGQIFTTHVMLRSRVVGRNGLTGADRFVNSMRPGEEVFVDVRIGSGGRRISSLNGTFDVELTVDPLNVFRESDERNNAARARVNISCR